MVRDQLSGRLRIIPRALLLKQMIAESAKASAGRAAISLVLAPETGVPLNIEALARQGAAGSEQ